MRLNIIPVCTGYWVPGTDYLFEVVTHIKGKIVDGDFLIISEKAICTATGSIVDESKVKPSSVSYLLARVWMRLVWGYILGAFSRLNALNIQRIRDYPIQEGSAHKQVSILYAGPIASLKHWSEGGIDSSNLPYSFSSIPLENPAEHAARLREKVRMELGCDVNVILGDSDKTFTFHGLHLSTRRSYVRGIRNLGFIAFLFGRFLRLRPRSTPVAYAGRDADADRLLSLTALANKARGHGAGRTVWDMAERFRSSPTEVTWGMLSSIPHYPIVIIRIKFRAGNRITRLSQPRRR
ncbi:MAG: coenzyme F420-0:L-glutamate ligase [Candidatus Bathyarchaeia archaeon]